METRKKRTCTIAKDKSFEKCNEQHFHSGFTDSGTILGTKDDKRITEIEEKWHLKGQNGNCNCNVALK